MIASDHIDNSPPVRDMHGKDYPPTLKVDDTSLDEAPTSPQSPFHLKGKLAKALLL